MKSDVKITDNRLQITRIFDAPRERVFAAWKRPEQLERWSGCNDSTKMEVTMDFRVGGAFRQTMDIAGRGTFTFHGVYDEIVEPERISWRAFFGPVTTKVVVQFFAIGDRTRVVLTQTGFPDERSLKTIQQGTEESLRALDAILTRTATHTAPPVITGVVE